MMVYFIFLLLYVDGMLVTTKNMQDVNKLEALFGKEFDMKDLGAAKKLLGMEIYKDRSSWNCGYLKAIILRNY